jgi:hypothetical protein
MALLFDEDYQTLAEANLAFIEDEATRFLIFTAFPLPEGLYVANGEPCKTVEVLYIIPENYNTSGGDMIWVYPMIARADGQPIPNSGDGGINQDSRTFNDKEYIRWSRHWNNSPWKPKVDKVQTIIDRITWILQYPDAKRP